MLTKINWMSRIMLIALCSIVEGQSGINCAKTFQPIEKTVRVRLKVMRIMQRAYAPSFFTQGSHAYKTQNLPCYASQEIDLDDGVYFPMTFVENNPAANKSLSFNSYAI